MPLLEKFENIPSSNLGVFPIMCYTIHAQKEWRNGRGYLRDACLSAQDRFKKVLDYFRIAYQGNTHGEA